MSPGLQPFLLPTWLFSSIWFKVLSTVSFCLLQMLPSWRLILPGTCAFDLVMKVPLGFPPPCLVSLYLPTQKQIQTPFLPSAGLASLRWTAKSKQKVGGLQGGSKVITSMWMIHSPKKFLVCRQGKMEKCPWGAIFFPIMKCMGADVRCGLSLGGFALTGFYFYSEFSVILWGIVQKISKVFPWWMPHRHGWFFFSMLTWLLTDTSPQRGKKVPCV